MLLEPHAGRLERRFFQRLGRFQLDRKQKKALAAITPGAAARSLLRDESLLHFFEQIEYSGRRLAKLNLPPNGILAALQEYDNLLTPTLQRLIPDEYANFQWVREQLQFCVILTLNNTFYQVRESETATFYELFRLEMESRNLDELLQKFLDAMTRFAGAAAGQLFLLDEGNARWALRASSPAGGAAPWEASATAASLRALARPRYMNGGGASMRAHVLDRFWPERYASVWSAPLIRTGRLAGVMQFGFERPYEWLPREREFLAAASERLLMAAERMRLIEDLAAREEQVRQLAEHMLQVEEAERRRISRELHDEAGQSLLCVRLQLEMLEQMLPESPPEWKARLRETRDVTEHTIIEIRRLIAALSPAILEQIGLAAALRQLVSRFRRTYPCRVRLHLSRLAGLPSKIDIIVYRLIQECCNNIAKHSNAKTVNISVASADGVLRLHIQDDGVGFHVDEGFAKRGSFGLAGIRERVAVLGGAFHLNSFPAKPAEAGGLARRGRPSRSERPKTGTEILIELPIPRKG